MLAVVLLAAVGSVKSSQNDLDQQVQPGAQAVPRAVQIKKCRFSNALDYAKKTARDPRAVAVAAFAALNYYNNGTACPLTKEAKNPALAATAGYGAYKAFQHENKWVKWGVAPVSALVSAAALLQPRK